jgi:hypothetical protein
MRNFSDDSFNEAKECMRAWVYRYALGAKKATPSVLADASKLPTISSGVVKLLCVTAIHTIVPHAAICVNLS